MTLYNKYQLLYAIIPEIYKDTESNQAGLEEALHCQEDSQRGHLGA